MSAASVLAFLAAHAPDIHVVAGAATLATVDDAAAGLGVAPEQIAKTMALDLGGEIVLLVLGGAARIDNRKFRDRFGTKPKLVALDKVEAVTGHPVGGVCPVGLISPLRIFCDRSLQAFDMVYPAAGAPNAAMRISPERLAGLTGAEWIDVARTTPG